MNELQHSVTTFIEENNPCENLISLIMEMKSRFWKDEDDKIVSCFKNNPTDFTRLYEKMTDKDFGVEDECIVKATKAFFNDEVVAKAKKYAEFFNEVREEGDPFFTFLLLLGFSQSGCTWWREDQPKEQNIALNS